MQIQTKSPFALFDKISFDYLAKSTFTSNSKNNISYLDIYWKFLQIWKSPLLFFFFSFFLK